MPNKPATPTHTVRVPDEIWDAAVRKAAEEGTTVTDPRHIRAATRPGDGGATKKVAGFETTPDGNGVVLEEQMMKVTANEMDFEAAATLYQKSLGLIRTAVRR